MVSKGFVFKNDCKWASFEKSLEKGLFDVVYTKLHVFIYYEKEHFLVYYEKSIFEDKSIQTNSFLAVFGNVPFCNYF